MTLPQHSHFTRKQWAALRPSTPSPLSQADLDRCMGVNEPISLEEVSEVYLPLSHLLSLHAVAAQALNLSASAFLRVPMRRAPYVIAIAGSVAVGKSTTARLLQALLQRWPDHPRVELVTTDGFLYPNAVLAERGLLSRKGFPESYDRRRLLAFMAAIKAGEAEVSAPSYSHVAYDIVPGAATIVRQPEIVIVEGLNVLQNTAQRGGALVSDFIDFSIFVDAEPAAIEGWYVERFMTLRRSVFQSPDSYFHRYATLSDEEALALAHGIWRDINAVNLQENVLPTRERANLVLVKDRGHAIAEVMWRAP
jgi:type I pantothenate kinase